MSHEIQHADLRLRRFTVIVLVLATLAAAALVFGFRHWLGELAALLPTEQLIAYLRRWIGIVAIACSLCVLVLAGYAATRARRVIAERRWPALRARVLRDTVVRHDEAALRVGRLLNVTALVLVVIGIASMLLSWRLFVL